VQEDIERVEGEIREVNHKITQIEGEIRACVGNAEKQRLESRLERLEHEKAQLRDKEKQLREKENLLLAQQGMLGCTAVPVFAVPGLHRESIGSPFCASAPVARALYLPLRRLLLQVSCCCSTRAALAAVYAASPVIKTVACVLGLSALLFPAGSASPRTALPRLVTVQMWNIETHRAEEIHNVLLTKRTWVELQATVKEAFMSRWTEENKGRFALYYIHDLLHPLETRADVGNQEQLDGYLAFLEKPPRDRGLMLFLNVAVIFQASGKPVSPVKPPLAIDTALARSYDGRPDRQVRSSSHLSPADVNSPTSPGTPREKEFRQVVLARDSDGCVRPDAARLGAPACIYRCVFCHKVFLPGKKQIEAAHVVPHAVSERLGKEVDVPTLLAIGGSIDSLGNGVSACSICHGRFDDGLIWVDMLGDAAPRTIVVHESIRGVDLNISPLHNTLLRTPSDSTFLFPGVVAWRWRKEWAELRRQQAEESVSRQLAELELQGSPQVKCSCARANINKQCRTGAGGTPTCKPCCRESGKSCATHNFAGAVSSASPSAVSAAAAAAAHP
jgi:hypothetical protein